MIKLDTPIQYLKGVGPKMSNKLSKLEIKAIQDLLFYFPRTWNDLSQVMPILQLRIGNSYNIKAKIIQISSQRSLRKKMSIISANVEDVATPEVAYSTGGYSRQITNQNDFTQATSGVARLKIVWFNQPFLIQNFKVGQTWIFSGKVEWDFQNQCKVMTSPTYESEAKIFPIYPETQGVTSKYLCRLIKNVLDQDIALEDYLPHEIKSGENLIDLNSAIRQIHQPNNQKEISEAKKRLAFDELFLIVLRMMIIKRELSVQNAPKMNVDKNSLVKLTKSLPYQLTNAQRKAAWEIIQNLSKSTPMNRLLEGDVGSGKTIVAAMATLNVIKNDYQVVWMAPTEILALQHFDNINRLLEEFDIYIALLTANNKARISDIKNQKSKIKNNDKQYAISDTLSADLIIGTHALIQEGIEFNNLGLVIIDEQHRFGVKQRAKLAASRTYADTKNHADLRGHTQRQSASSQRSSALVPHFLSMTATPIPRTLALSLYGDLDISVLDEIPKGRQKVITRLVDPVNRDKAYQFIRDQVRNGRQAFVICSLIEENDKRLAISNKLFDLERKSVKKEYEKLSNEIFPDLKIAIMHGRMKAKEKEKIMSDFKNSKINILVSTSVIEVGIDVPNATIMMIENADRFGLAQLHQFRGRVGRGKHQSYCLLFSSSLSSEENRRLKSMVECNDGFKLAEKDLEIRGPGQFAGSLQHGLPDLKMASLTDIILLTKVRRAAEKIVNHGIENYFILSQKIKEFDSLNHLE